MRETELMKKAKKARREVNITSTPTIKWSNMCTCVHFIQISYERVKKGVEDERMKKAKKARSICSKLLNDERQFLYSDVLECSCFF